MRYAMTVALSVVVASSAPFSTLALAQSAGPLVRTIAKHVEMQQFETATYTYQCPTGYIPIAYSFITRSPNSDSYLETDRSLIDKAGAKLSRSSMSSLEQIDGGGLTQSLYNINCHAQQFEGFVSCLSSAASTDSKLAMAKASTSAPRTSVGVATAFCPADSPVALGGFSNADGTILQDTASAPVWGSSASPILLADLADGPTGPPTGWQAKVFNSGNGTLGIDSVAVCGKAPSLQTYVYSATLPTIAFGISPFSIFSPVPDGWTAVGSGFDGGQYGRYSAMDLWMGDGNVVSMMQWYPTLGGYDSDTAEVRAFNLLGYSNAPTGTAARAVTAVLAVPKAAPPPTNVAVVEFYHAALDHYFITGIQKEISDLDTGVHTGWARTGQTFKAYGIGSTGRAGRRPVCRVYGLPPDIDSHFYSARLDECTRTMVNFGDAWLRPGTWGFEASEVFQMDLPDPVTGACPPNGVPIYRVFNQRKDANHRYTTSIAIRDQMVARGGIAEGDGPNAVVLCGLP